MTRKEDIFVPASQRIKAMSDENINFCISIHSGYSPNKDNRGSLVFLKGPESLKIAELIQNNLYGLMHGHFTEPKPIKAYIFSETRTACCLLETGFLSNESDLEYILKKEGQKSIAKAIYRAIASSGN
jgi:N-acetylmuramoyl-L-alanine amidase